MFRLLAFQVALAEIWMRSIFGVWPLYQFGYGRALLERKAAMDAQRDLDRIIGIHSAAHRQRVDNI